MNKSFNGNVAAHTNLNDQSSIRLYRNTNPAIQEVMFVCGFHQSRYNEAANTKERKMIKLQFKKDIHQALKFVSKDRLYQMAFEQEWDLAFEDEWKANIDTDLTEVGFMLLNKFKRK